MSKTLAHSFFCDYLPDEMEYSARKTGYNLKVERAKLPPEDRTSTYGFLAQEWANAQLLHEQGADYRPDYGMSTQLQLAKFAVGLFDKVGVYNWLVSGVQTSPDEFAHVAIHTARLVVAEAPWKDADPVDMTLRFDQTPFSEGIKSVMEDIQGLSSEHGDRTIGARLFNNVMNLGARAAATYIEFADDFLKPEQLVIPRSKIAT